jgi:hypothetical protein
MRSLLFVNKDKSELERICTHLIGGVITSPGKEADKQLTRAYSSNRTLLSNCVRQQKTC